MARLLESDKPAIRLESVRLLRASLPATITIQTKLSPGTSLVRADATQIHQLLLNLIGNGLKFHAPDRAPVVTMSMVWSVSSARSICLRSISSIARF